SDDADVDKIKKQFLDIDRIAKISPIILQKILKSLIADFMY
ncbi:10228_t:CDS:1, partial [Gigaspora rosea]